MARLKTDEEKYGLDLRTDQYDRPRADWEKIDEIAEATGKPFTYDGEPLTSGGEGARNVVDRRDIPLTPGDLDTGLPQSRWEHVQSRALEQMDEGDVPNLGGAAEAAYTDYVDSLHYAQYTADVAEGMHREADFLEQVPGKQGVANRLREMAGKWEKDMRERENDAAEFRDMLVSTNAAIQGVQQGEQGINQDWIAETSRMVNEKAKEYADKRAGELNDKLGAIKSGKAKLETVRKVVGGDALAVDAVNMAFTKGTEKWRDVMSKVPVDPYLLDEAEPETASDRQVQAERERMWGDTKKKLGILKSQNKDYGEFLSEYEKIVGGTPFESAMEGREEQWASKATLKSRDVAQNQWRTVKGMEDAVSANTALTKEEAKQWGRAKYRELRGKNPTESDKAILKKAEEMQVPALAGDLEAEEGPFGEMQIVVKPPSATVPSRGSGARIGDSDIARQHALSYGVPEDLLEGQKRLSADIDDSSDVIEQGVSQISDSLSSTTEAEFNLDDLTDFQNEIERQVSEDPTGNRAEIIQNVYKNGNYSLGGDIGRIKTAVGTALAAGMTEAMKGINDSIADAYEEKVRDVEGEFGEAQQAIHAQLMEGNKGEVGNEMYARMARREGRDALMSEIATASSIPDFMLESDRMAVLKHGDVGVSYFAAMAEQLPKGSEAMERLTEASNTYDRYRNQTGGREKLKGMASMESHMDMINELEFYREGLVKDMEAEKTATVNQLARMMPETPVKFGGAPSPQREAMSPEDKAEQVYASGSYARVGDRMVVFSSVELAQQMNTPEAQKYVSSDELMPRAVQRKGGKMSNYIPEESKLARKLILFEDKQVYGSSGVTPEWRSRIEHVRHEIQKMGGTSDNAEDIDKRKNDISDLLVESGLFGEKENTDRMAGMITRMGTGQIDSEQMEAGDRPTLRNFLFEQNFDMESDIMTNVEIKMDHARRILDEVKDERDRGDKSVPQLKRKLLNGYRRLANPAQSELAEYDLAYMDVSDLMKKGDGMAKYSPTMARLQQDYTSLKNEYDELRDRMTTRPSERGGGTPVAAPLAYYPVVAGMK